MKNEAEDTLILIATAAADARRKFEHEPASIFEDLKKIDPTLASAMPNVFGHIQDAMYWFTCSAHLCNQQSERARIQAFYDVVHNVAPTNSKNAPELSSAVTARYLALHSSFHV